MGKRANGEGTITKRKDGRWEAAAYAPTLDGVTKRIRIYAPTRKEAHARLVGKLDEVRRGVPTADTTLTVGEYLQTWLETVVPRRNRRNTAAGYESGVRLHITPRIGHIRLIRLSVRDVQKAANAILDEGHSLRTAQKFRTILSAALTRAMRDELITRNVARLIELPKAQRKEFVPWSPDEAATFLRTAHGHPWYVAYLLALTYGLREGEILGLRWADVDFASDQLTIRQQISRIDGALRAAPVKTDAGNRRLPLVPFVRKALLEHARATGAVVNELVPPIPPQTFTTTDTVLVSKVGTPVEPRGLLRTFDILTARAGLRRITIHQTRHTVATLLGTLGISPRDVQLILGHAHISTTQQIYQHGDPQSRRDAIQAVSNALETRLGKPSTEAPDDAPERAGIADGCRQNAAVAVSPALPRTHPLTEVMSRFSDPETATTIVSSNLQAGGSSPPRGTKLTSVISAFADISHDQLVLLEVRTKRRVFGAVAVNGCRQTVTSTVASAPLSDAALGDLIALRAVLRSAIAAQQRRAEFPSSLIPTDRLDPMEEAA